LASSSALSKEKSVTPQRSKDSPMAGRALTGCMKWTSADGKSLRTSLISAIEPQSKCLTPPAHSAASTVGSGLHFTA